MLAAIDMLAGQYDRPLAQQTSSVGAALLFCVR